MKITNNLKNPTVTFIKLAVGDVFMTLAGDVYLKLSEFRRDAPIVNSFCLNSLTLLRVADDTETVPLEAELILKRNTYEQYK